MSPHKNIRYRAAGPVQRYGSDDPMGEQPKGSNKLKLILVGVVVLVLLAGAVVMQQSCQPAPKQEVISSTKLKVKPIPPAPAASNTWSQYYGVNFNMGAQLLDVNSVKVSGLKSKHPVVVYQMGIHPRKGGNPTWMLKTKHWYMGRGTWGPSPGRFFPAASVKVTERSGSFAAFEITFRLDDRKIPASMGAKAQLVGQGLSLVMNQIPGVKRNLVLALDVPADGQGIPETRGTGGAAG